MAAVNARRVSVRAGVSSRSSDARRVTGGDDDRGPDNQNRIRVRHQGEPCGRLFRGRTQPLRKGPRAGRETPGMDFSGRGTKTSTSSDYERKDGPGQGRTALIDSRLLRGAPAPRRRSSRNRAFPPPRPFFFSPAPETSRPTKGRARSRGERDTTRTTAVTPDATTCSFRSPQPLRRRGRSST